MQTRRDVQTAELVHLSRASSRVSSLAFWGGSRNSSIHAARWLVYFAGFLCACGELESEPVAEVFESVTVSAAATAKQSRIYPSKLTMQRGKVSSQPLTVLATQDQSGTVDTWANYLEFSPGTADLQATFVFVVPDSLTPAQLQNLTLVSNYKGPKQSTQSWSFQLYDVTQSRWVAIGDNQGAAGWSWSTLAFAPVAAAQNFISATREITLRFTTKTAVDNCDLDYLALTYTTDGTPSSTPASQTVWTPAPGTSWQIQFTGTIDTSINVKAFDLDLFATTKETISKLHTRGTKAICYFSGGSSESYSPDFSSFPSSVLGTTLDGYPAERWLDVRQLAILGPIMTARMDLAVQKGCDAVDVDNMDGYTNKPGFAITYAQQLAYNKFIAAEAHKRGLSIGLKNDLLQIKDLVDAYDFAINESCLSYSECYYMQPFIDRKKAVFAISYTGSQSSVCSQVASLNFDMLLKNESLDAYRVSCR